MIWGSLLFVKKKHRTNVYGSSVLILANHTYYSYLFQCWQKVTISGRAWISLFRWYFGIFWCTQKKWKSVLSSRWSTRKDQSCLAWGFSWVITSFKHSYTFLFILDQELESSLSHSQMYQDRCLDPMEMKPEVIIQHKRWWKLDAVLGWPCIPVMTTSWEVLRSEQAEP